MDATFGTNSAGMDLFAVLAELDGSGIPVAYCFLDKTATKKQGTSQSIPGSTTSILVQLLQRVKSLGFNPTFFTTDKDQAEISAIRQVWPRTSIQLCYWHAKRALRTKLKDRKLTNTQTQYHPEEAQRIVPHLEMCWGTLPSRRPAGHGERNGLGDDNGRCSCDSRSIIMEEKGSIETSDPKDQEVVLDILCRHYNSHPLIPDKNGTFRPSAVIYAESAAEMYNWCRARNFSRLWAYLFIQWYRPDQWVLWARAANAIEIPVLKTTMVVESHWRKIKHDHLHRFNCPRVDQVVWIMVSRVVPDMLRRMDALLSGNTRRAISSWRAPFKKEWTQLEIREVEPRNLQSYHTDPVQWTCGCEAFLHSRFLVCKHILFCYQPISNPIDFFSTVTRGKKFPFWKHEQLKLRDEFLPREAGLDTTRVNEGEALGGEDVLENEISDVLEDENLSADNLVDVDLMEDDFPEAEALAFDAAWQAAGEIYREQVRDKNTKYVRAFMRSGQKIVRHVEEVKYLRNRHTMPATWTPGRHPATTYYRKVSR